MLHHKSNLSLSLSLGGLSSSACQCYHQASNWTGLYLHVVHSSPWAQSAGPSHAGTPLQGLGAVSRCADTSRSFNLQILKTNEEFQTLIPKEGNPQCIVFDVRYRNSSPEFLSFCSP
jgi:hypothetical protein